MIARGLGRSYGDPAQNAGGIVLDMTGLARPPAIDADTGVAVVDGGVSLDTLMRAALPLGWWVPVLPGTRQVTIGGAIGADVHGKNHHTKGSFGNHVLSIDLVTADGTVRTLTPDGPEAELFWATVGGMGLTGVIVAATVQLHRTESAYFVVDTDRTRDLDELLALLTDGSDDTYGYSAAWFDTTTTGAKLGRAVLTRGSLATRDQLPAKLRDDPLKFEAPQLLTFPDAFPNGLVNRATLRAFSELWYRKAPRRQRGAIQNITAFFQVLDLFGDWNRVYGSRGFLQYQFLVPFGAEQCGRIVEKIGASRHASVPERAQAVRCGKPGAAVVPAARLDDHGRLPDRAGAAPLLRRARRPGGRGRRPALPGEGVPDDRTTFKRGYPRFEEWRKVRDAADPDGVFVSDMARRLELTGR